MVNQSDPAGRVRPRIRPLYVVVYLLFAATISAVCLICPLGGLSWIVFMPVLYGFLYATYTSALLALARKPRMDIAGAVILGMFVFPPAAYIAWGVVFGPKLLMPRNLHTESHALGMGLCIIVLSPIMWASARRLLPGARATLLCVIGALACFAVWIAVPSAAYELLAMWTWHMIVMSAYAVASYRERHRWCPSGSQCPVSVSSHEALNVPVYPECGSALESPPDDQRVPIARISGSANVAP